MLPGAVGDRDGAHCWMRGDAGQGPRGACGASWHTNPAAKRAAPEICGVMNPL